MAEIIDIYDENRVFTGRSVERGTFLNEGEFMLNILAIIQNAEGKFLITQRSMDKSWGAGWWEVPGGGVSAGETTSTSIVREVAEEVGLDVSGEELNVLYNYTNVDLKHGSNYIVDIFGFALDFDESDVVLQAEEVMGFKLATWEEIEEIAERGEFLHFARIRTALGK